MNDVTRRNRDRAGRFAEEELSESTTVQLDTATTVDVPASGSHLATTAPFGHQTLTPSNRMATETVRNVNDGTTIVDPPYQRGDVWSDDQRRLLIASALRGLPIPAIIVNDRGTPNWAKNNGGYPDRGLGLYAIVDGKQRVETFRQFFDSELAVPASWFNPEDIEASIIGADGTEWITFDGLTKRSQRRCENHFNIPTITAQAATVEEEAELYLTVNGAGVAQSDDDLANAARVAAGES